MNISTKLIFFALFGSLEGYSARVSSSGDYFKNDG